MATTLITGASSGIGEQLAMLFAADGDDVVLVARSEDKLKTLAERLTVQHGITANVIVSDLAKPDAAQVLLAEIQRRNLQIDTLVNNAGFGDLGDFWQLDSDRQHDMMMVNIVALTDLTRSLLPGMIQRAQSSCTPAGVLNVGSIAGYLSGPYMSVYYATKAYVLSITTALQSELRGTGVTVTLLAPGATKTGFGEDSGMGELKMFADAAMDVQAVAAAGHRAYRAGDAVTIPGWKNRLLVRATHFIPRRLKAKVIANIQRPGSGDIS